MKGKTLYIKHAITENQIENRKRVMLNQISNQKGEWSKRININMRELNMHLELIKTKELT